MDRDRIILFQKTLRQIFEKYSQFKLSYADVEIELVLDDDRGHYELWQIGWQGHKRIHACILHVDIKDGKIWIQHDGIHEGITDELLEAGIQPKEIVLAFHSPTARRHLPFAVA